MYRNILCGVLLLSVCGCGRQDMRLCGPSNVRVSPVKQKPLVAFMPVFDQSKHNQTWNVAERLTSNIFRTLSLKDRLYVIDQEKMARFFTEMKTQQDPFGTDLLWIKKKFREEEFVAFVELEKLEETLLDFKSEIPAKECNAELYFSARVRIFDLRNPVPKLVLSEIVSHSETIPKEFTKLNRGPTTPEQENFASTPQAKAHDNFAKEIAERIEDYVLLAQKP